MYYLVSISVILLGIIFMSLSQSFYIKNYTTYNKRQNSPCHHSMVAREQLKGPEKWYKYNYEVCSQGFKVMDNPYSYTGTRCTNCGKKFFLLILVVVVNECKRL
jgi:DNA-directed RNA polymerase subunit RPC12/RpoP